MPKHRFQNLLVPVNEVKRLKHAFTKFFAIYEIFCDIFSIWNLCINQSIYINTRFFFVREPVNFTEAHCSKFFWLLQPQFVLKKICSYFCERFKMMRNHNIKTMLMVCILKIYLLTTVHFIHEHVHHLGQ